MRTKGYEDVFRIFRLKCKIQCEWDDYWTAGDVLYTQREPLNLIILNFVGGREMRDWMDFDGDGEVDSCERMFAEEMLCTSKEEHEALFGDAGDFDDDMEDDFEIDAMAAGLDVDELELMDPDERAEALEEAGLDPDDYDFY